MLNNKILISAVVAWFISQLLKNALYLIKNKRFDFRLLLTSGGMPSSHSAVVMALVTSVGKYEGVSSALFAVVLIIAFIVITDAVGVRRAAGQQARVLNIMLEEYMKEGKIHAVRLKELIGHTPFEVIIGGLLGILVGLFI